MKPSLRCALRGLTLSAIVLPLGGCRSVAQRAAQVAVRQLGGTMSSSTSGGASANAAYIQSLMPLASGSGLVVCEPVPVAAMKSEAAWGTGAARWLQVQVAGQPELGKTPLWGVPENARLWLKYPDLKLSGARADALGKACGVTHVAVGTLGGTPQAATLVYQLREIKTGKTIGTAKISGPMARLNAQLPFVARALAARLGVKSALPTAIALAPDELKFLGTPKLKSTYKTDVMAPAAQKRLQSLVAKDALAGILAGRWCEYNDDKAWQAAADAMRRSASRNALVWAEIAYAGPIRIVDAADKLAALQQKYPRNYLLAKAGSSFEGGNRAWASQVNWAETAARAAPACSFAWADLADALGNQAQALRLGRYGSDISGAEWSKLNALYARKHAAALQATKVAPLDANAWATVAEAATFNGDSAGARTALKQALALDPANAYAWRWGMQMTQRKWGGSMAEYSAFATRAAANADKFDFPADDASRVFYDAGQRPAFKAILQTVVAKDPRNVEALTELGGIYHYDDRTYKKAEKLYRQALAVSPNNARTLSMLGDITYWVHHDAAGAESLYHRAIAADPTDGYYHANLGRMLALTGRKPQGIAEAKLAKKYGFNGASTHEVWSVTGVSPP